MIEYKGALIFQSYIEHQWTAVFGYGDYVQTKTMEAAKKAVDVRREQG